MDGLRVLVVTLLLCLAPIGGVVVASDSPVDPQQDSEDIERPMTVFTAHNTSGYLAPEIDDIDRTDAQTSAIDVAGAVDADAGELRSTYRTETLQQRYAAAETTTEREQILEDGAERLFDRADELAITEQAAIRQYNDGAVSTRELLRGLTIVTREAHETMRALEWLESSADDLGMDSVAERAATEQVHLMPMQGPVRSQLSDAMAGETTLRVHVETVDDGVVIAAIDQRTQTYVREAHDPTAKAADRSDRYGGNPSPALDRFSELYPWAINSFDGIDAIGPEQVRLYRFSATHSHGELETYLDSGSTEILYEKQRLDPNGMPSTVLERTEGDLRLVVNTTRGGGPLGISVLDATTEDPVDATIELNDDPIGSTDGDRRWTLAPRGTMTINATHNGEAVTLETSLE